MMQASLFDALHKPALILRVDPDGPVVQDPDEVLRFPHPRMAWDRATIQLHRYDDGLWMWSTGWHCNDGGCGYCVGPKWGKFAESRDDALFYAAREIESALEGNGSVEARDIIAWVAML